VKEAYLSIKVVSKKLQSKYSLIVQTSEQFKILTNGIFTSFDIASNDTVELLYHSEINNLTEQI